MNEQMMNEVLKRLDALAAKMGEGAAFTWEAMVRQQFFVNGVLLAAVYALLLIAAVVATVYIVKWAKSMFSDVDNVQDGEVGFSLFCSLVTLVLYAVSLYNGVAAVSHIINPQYYALMDLAKLVGLR